MVRLDKYLKVSRLVKRRTVAKEIADKGRISINDKVAKSSTDVKAGDQIKLVFGNKVLVIVVQAIKESTKKADAQEMYRIVKEEKR